MGGFLLILCLTFNGAFGTRFFTFQLGPFGTEELCLKAGEKIMQVYDRQPRVDAEYVCVEE